MKEFIDKLIEWLEEARRKEFMRLGSYLEDEYGYSNCDNAFEDGETKGAYDAYGEVLSFVYKLAEEYKGGWIACSERLPEKYTPVLVFLNNKEMCVFTLETDFEDSSAMYWEDWYGYHKKISETIAWQPLPAPYTEGE